MKTRPIPMIKPFWMDIAHVMVEYVRSGQYERDCKVVAYLKELRREED